jgi:hypothetical protein
MISSPERIWPERDSGSNFSQPWGLFEDNRFMSLLA